MLSTEERILAIVVEILETDGYDAVQLREVARRGRMSLATIYKRYATRDELILAAMAGADEAFIADLDVVISNLVHGLSARYAAGEIAITDILPGLDRAVHWMTRGYEMGGAG